MVWTVSFSENVSETYLNGMLSGLVECLIKNQIILEY